MQAVGVDATRGGWLAVVLEAGAFDEARLFCGFGGRGSVSDRSCEPDPAPGEATISY